MHVKELLDSGHTIEKLGITLKKEEGSFPYVINIDNTPLKGEFCGGSFSTMVMAWEFFSKRVGELKAKYEALAK
jgi:hypothetical protein